MKLANPTKTCYLTGIKSTRIRYFSGPVIENDMKGFITDEEFLSTFRNCKPPGEWPERIVVAFSGGPDSTCLLFLLHRLLRNRYLYGTPRFPNSLLSIYIDHDLQATSAEMVQHCSQFAASLSVPHESMKIPWSDNPFPPKPEEGAFEKIARDARYDLLFRAMQKENVDLIAFGHHADDQVETALLRLARGSSEIGAGGMRPCRRLGMGLSSGSDSVGWFGHLGMTKWIVRPLLQFSKARILATCDKYQLPYVNDPTNFEAHITPRNAIRKILQMSADMQTADSEISRAENPLLDLLKNTDLASVTEPLKLSNADLFQKRKMEQLRRTVYHLSQRVEAIDLKVSELLEQCLLPSPISTILLTSDQFVNIKDYSIRLAMLLRILRYVSPLPWGSVEAEAGRRSASLRRLEDTLMGGVSHRHPLVIGGSVLWSPISVTALGEIKWRLPLLDEKLGWLATRQPPVRDPKISKKLQIDITSELISAFDKKISFQLLYDCRFLITIDPERLPPEVVLSVKGRFSSAKVFIEPTTHYFLPQIIWRRKPSADILLAHMKPTGTVAVGRVKWQDKKIHVNDRIIAIEWIRTIDSDSPRLDQPVKVPRMLDPFRPRRTPKFL